MTPEQKKKHREASRERTHSGHKSYRQAHDADRGQKKPDRNVRKYWEPAPSMRSGPKGKLPEEDMIEGPLQDRRRAQAKKRQAMDLLRRKQAQQRMSAAKAQREKEKTDIQARKGLRAAQASKHAQRNWRAEDVDIDEKKLSYKERQGLSSSQFALPGKGSGPEGKQGGSYPIPDESHARNALARVSQHGTEAEKSKVRRAVAKKFPNIKIGEDVEIDEGPPTPKFKPLRHKVWSADASIPSGARPKKPGKIPKYRVGKSGMGAGAPTNITVGEDGKALPTSAETDAAFRKYMKRRRGEIKRQKLAKAWRKHDTAVKRMDRQRKEDHDCNESHPGMTHKEWVEDQKIEATYSERISSDVPSGNASGARGSKKKELFKSRKFRNATPGQSRDFERLSATRMFQAYEQKTDEDAPTTSTAGVANWDPLLGGKKATIYTRKRRRIDGRTKDYKETVQRVQARRDALAARELEQKLNMFGVTSNPFKEEIEMDNNKKYLKTKVGSIEEAVLHSLGTEKPVNPNDARPTLHLPEKKYLHIKEGSLENAVTDVMTEAGATKKQVRMARGIANDPRHRGGDMTGAWKKAEKIKKGLGDHPKVQDALRKANESSGVVKSGHGQDYDKDGDIDSKDYMTARDRAIKKTKARIKNKLQPESAGARGERDIGSQAYTDYVKNLTPGEGDSAIVAADAQKSAKASQETNKEKKIRSTRIDDEYVAEKEVDVKDTRRTVDAIRAYDRSKDASRDADWDTEHGKKKKGDKEKKYAKKERGEIDKDDPDWKHRKYHTGMHGEGIKHDCASHVKHEEYGVGKCIAEQHTLVETEEGEGYVTHYDVMFDSTTIIKDVPVEELEILEKWPHTHGKKGVKENNISDDDYDHATALYKDQWKDRKIADYDKERGRDSRAKEMRKDAEVDRKRMWGMTGDKWKHAKYATGEEEGKRDEVGNTPDPKDAYKEEMSPLIAASINAISKFEKEETDWKDKSDQEKKAKAKSQFDAILKKKLGNPKKYDSPIKVREEEEETETVLEITSLDNLIGVDHHEWGFETRAEMIEFAMHQIEDMGRSVKEPAVSDADVAAFKKKNPEKFKVLKPSLKGMALKQRKIVRARKEK